MADELFGEGVDRAEVEHLKAAIRAIPANGPVQVIGSFTIDHVATKRVQEFLDAWFRNAPGRTTLADVTDLRPPVRRRRRRGRRMSEHPTTV